MKKLLILDNNRRRLEELCGIAKRMPDVQVDGRCSITRSEYEAAQYTSVIVHANNVEGAYVEGEWERGRSVVVLFSGSFVSGHDVYEEVHYVSEAYLKAHLVDFT